MRKKKKRKSSKGNSSKTKIYCIQCKTEVQARLTNGQEIYPRRQDLSMLPFWKCDTCGNYVGCHHKTQNPTQPLGCIPNAEMRNARWHIHRLMDLIKATGKISTNQLYRKLSQKLSIRHYHTAEISTIEEARNVYRALQIIQKSL